MAPGKPLQISPVRVVCGLVLGTLFLVAGRFLGFLQVPKSIREEFGVAAQNLPDDLFVRSPVRVIVGPLVHVHHHAERLPP